MYENYAIKLQNILLNEQCNQFMILKFKTIKIR